MYYCRRPFLNLHSSRLDAVAKSFRFNDQKTELDPDIWVAARHGDKDAMKYVVAHCEQDVKVLRELWPRIVPFIRNIHY